MDGVGILVQFLIYVMSFNYKFRILSKKDIIDEYGLATPNWVLDVLQTGCIKFLLCFTTLPWRFKDNIVKCIPLSTEDEVKNCDLNLSILNDPEFPNTEEGNELRTAIMKNISCDNKDLVLNFMNSNGSDF